MLFGHGHCTESLVWWFSGSAISRTDHASDVTVAAGVLAERTTAGDGHDRRHGGRKGRVRGQCAA